MRRRPTAILALFLVGGGATGLAGADRGDPEPAYRAVPIHGEADLATLRSELGDEGMVLVHKLNRRDGGHIGPGNVLVVPEDPGSALDHSPFPAELPRTAALPKLVLVSLRVQAFAAYEYGRQVLWGPVSSGSERHPTPTTLFHANWRSPRRASSINPAWIMKWYLNIHTAMGLALHEYALPGIPASRGCVRLLHEDAVWLYDWADLSLPASAGRLAAAYGTPVVIFGEYDYQSAPPWMALVNDPATGRVSAEELDEVLDRYLQAMERRSNERQTLAQ